MVVHSNINNWVHIDTEWPYVGEYVFGAVPIEDNVWMYVYGKVIAPTSTEETKNIVLIETEGGGWHCISHWMKPTPPECSGRGVFEVCPKCKGIITETATTPKGIWSWCCVCNQVIEPGKELMWVSPI